MGGWRMICSNSDLSFCSVQVQQLQLEGNVMLSVTQVNEDFWETKLSKLSKLSKLLTCLGVKPDEKGHL